MQRMSHTCSARMKEGIGFTFSLCREHERESGASNQRKTHPALYGLPTSSLKLRIRKHFKNAKVDTCRILNLFLMIDRLFWQKTRSQEHGALLLCSMAPSDATAASDMLRYGPLLRSTAILMPRPHACVDSFDTWVPVFKGALLSLQAKRLRIVLNGRYIIYRNLPQKQSNQDETFYPPPPHWKFLTLQSFASFAAASAAFEPRAARSSAVDHYGH